MAAVVVVESMFGSTMEVARAVAEGIATLTPVQVVEVGTAPPIESLEVDLLVVGAPTHAFVLSRPSTRDDAAQQAGGPVVSAGIGVREWLDTGTRCNLSVAAFDTHVSHPDLPGHAGRAAQKRLRRLGCTPVVAAASFAVDGVRGPLGPGELDRARRWGEHVAGAAFGEVGVLVT